MIMLKGILRRMAAMKFKDGRERVKLMIEHDVSREEGQGDLELTTGFIDPEQAKTLKEGSEIVLDVRPYVSKGALGMSFVRVIKA